MSNMRIKRTNKGQEPANKSQDVKRTQPVPVLSHDVNSAEDTTHRSQRDVNDNVTAASSTLNANYINEGINAALSKIPRNVRSLTQWNNDRVLVWLKKYCSSQQCYDLYADLFREHEITGQVLIGLNDSKLSLIGINNFHHRQAILLQILRLKLACDSLHLEQLLAREKDSTSEET